MEKYTMASHIYNFGRNSLRNDLEYHSLKSFATNLDRIEVEPFFQQFEDYYNNQNYADVTIQQTLNGEGKWNDAAMEQRTAVIITTIPSGGRRHLGWATALEFGQFIV
jgi:hypothetical protein